MAKICEQGVPHYFQMDGWILILAESLQKHRCLLSTPACVASLPANSTKPLLSPGLVWDFFLFF